jgi:hypothetical protein
MGSLEISDDGGLSEIVTKQLLQDFEASGETREDFDLHALVSSNPIVYGEKGSSARRRVQRRWSHIKRKSTEKYKLYLEGIGVVPSTLTQASILRDCQPPWNSTAMADNEGEWSDYDSHQRTPPQKAHRKACLPHSSHGNDDASLPASAASGRMGSQPFSPGLPPTPQRTTSETPCVTNPHVFGTTTLMGAPDSSISTGGLSWSKYQDGTRRNPWIVNIDALHPERNREFDIEWITKKKHRKWYRDIFHIRMSCSPFDHKKFKACVPTGYPFEYKKRLILVQGVSQCAWIKNTNQYHAGKAGIKCEATKGAHSNTQIKIGNDPEREWCWWLLVFNAHVVLDNQILSEDEFNIPTQYNSITSLAKENAHKRDLRAMTIFWEIAVEGGAQVEEYDECPPDEDLF